jgi:hypothetical protein
VRTGENPTLTAHPRAERPRTIRHVYTNGDAAAHISRDRTKPSNGAPVGEKSSAGGEIKRNWQRNGARVPRPDTLIPVELKPGGGGFEAKNPTNESKGRRHAARGTSRRNSRAEPLRAEEKSHRRWGCERKHKHGRRRRGWEISAPTRLHLNSTPGRAARAIHGKGDPVAAVAGRTNDGGACGKRHGRRSCEPSYEPNPSSIRRTRRR